MPVDRSKVRTNTYPKMSLNSLGEYLTVGPGRRKSIIKNQKFQSTFITARYKQAEKAIIKFILDGSRDVQGLEDTTVRILSKRHKNDWHEQVAENCADAIDSFRDMVDDLPLRGVTPVRPVDSSAKMSIADVSVSVRPEIILKNNHGETVGAIKLYFRKSKELSKESGKLIATVLRRYLITHISDEGTVLPTKCMVIDIFSGQVHNAPKAYIKSMRDVTSACEEIAVRWPSITL